MGLFQKHKNTTAYAKVGLMGFAGAGKTYTATTIAIGLHKLLVEGGHAKPNKPVDFLDTETGSDWVKPRFEQAGINLRVAKTRAFVDLLTACRECRHILIIDSITHVWRELCESWRRRRRKKDLSFADWTQLKDRWGEFTDWFVNSPCHIIMCGRAGFEYDMYQDSDNRWQVRKSGIKMNTEKESGHEPSLLVRMDRRQIETDTAAGYQMTHTAVVLKDRADMLTGRYEDDPRFSFFAPHFSAINLGGKHLGVDTSRTSDDSIEPPDNEGRYRRDRCEALLDDIQATMVKHFPGQTKDEKQQKVQLLEKFFGHPGWTAVTQLSEDELREGFGRLRAELEPESFQPTTEQQLEEMWTDGEKTQQVQSGTDSDAGTDSGESEPAPF